MPSLTTPSLPSTRGLFSTFTSPSVLSLFLTRAASPRYVLLSTRRQIGKEEKLAVDLGKAPRLNETLSLSQSLLWRHGNFLHSSPKGMLLGARCISLTHALCPRHPDPLDTCRLTSTDEPLHLPNPPLAENPGASLENQPDRLPTTFVLRQTPNPPTEPADKRMHHSLLPSCPSHATTVPYREAGASRPAREPEALAPGTAVFKPRVVRFVLPRVFCHARGLPDGVMLKVRTEPGGAEGSAPGFTGDRDGEGAHVLGRIGADQCVIGLATSGDWLQARRGGGGACSRAVLFVSEVEPFSP